MICPICGTNNSKTQGDIESCVQCGSDLNVHKLLAIIATEIKMKNAASKQQLAIDRANKSVILMQTIPTVLLLIGTLFGIFVGFKFLNFLDDKLNQPNLKSSGCMIEIDQLQQMSSIVAKQLDLIVEQRKENQGLQAKVQESSQYITNLDKEPPTTTSALEPEINNVLPSNETTNSKNL